MKTLFTLILAAMSLNLIAQETTTNTAESRPRTDNPDEMKTLFNQGMALGGYLATTTKFGQLNDGYGLWTGGQVTCLLGHSLGIGLAGYGLVNAVETNTLNSDGERYYYQMGYGGLQIEPVIWPREVLHITAPVLIGAGGVGETPYHPYEAIDDYWEDINVTESSAFLVVEPGVNLELNICKIVRFDVGASYRFVTESDLPGTSDSQLSGFSGQVSLKLGWF